MARLTLFLIAAILAAEPLRWQANHVKEIMPGCNNLKNGCAHAEYTSSIEIPYSELRDLLKPQYLP
jgi:hypothetical protein